MSSSSSGHIRLSIVIPVYNERDTIGTVLERVRSVEIPEEVSREIVIVDDGSTDGTSDFLNSLSGPEIIVIHHLQNRGKGAAFRTALEQITGHWVLIQDADLEYSPEDYPRLLAPLLKDRSPTIVFGSRFLGDMSGMKWHHYVANKLLTLATNLLFGCRITDLCTCYKLYKTSDIRGISLVRNGFDLEHELTAKLLKRKHEIYEVPITYRGRDVESGKKVRWTDFFVDLYTLIENRIK